MTYPELVAFCGGSERQAALLAKHVPYRRLNEAQLVEHTLALFVRIAEKRLGEPAGSLQ